MGIFDSVAKITDPGDFFGARAGAKAAEDARALGQQSLGLQSDWMDYMKAQNQPFSESALRALPIQEAMVGLGGPEAQQAEVQNIMQSPFYNQMLQQGEEAVLRGQAATGGLRSGGAQQALAQNSQNVLQGLWSQKLQNLGGLSTRGAGAQGLMQQGGAQALGDMTGTLGQIGNIGINQAAQQQNKAMGMVGLAASLFSDERLKTNINKIGEKNGLPLYEWDWNKTARDKFGLSGSKTGHMVSDVEIKYPEAVGSKDGYKTVNYGMIEELA